MLPVIQKVKSCMLLISFHSVSSDITITKNTSPNPFTLYSDIPNMKKNFIMPEPSVILVKIFNTLIKV